MTLLALLLSAETSWGASPLPQLEPDDSIFSSFEREYSTAVREALLTGVPLTAFSVVTIPSFTPEWAAWVEIEPEPRACSRIVPAPIWNGAEPTRPNLPGELPAPKCAPLTAKLAKSIANAWLGMLWGVRYQSSDVMGGDGVGFHFAGFCPGPGILAGQTWSPEAGTPTARLVALAEALRAYSVDPSSEAADSLRKRAAAVPLDRRLTRRCS